MVRYNSVKPLCSVFCRRKKSCSEFLCEDKKLFWVLVGSHLVCLDAWKWASTRGNRCLFGACPVYIPFHCSCSRVACLPSQCRFGYIPVHICSWEHTVGEPHTVQVLAFLGSSTCQASSHGKSHFA